MSKRAPHLEHPLINSKQQEKVGPGKILHNCERHACALGLMLSKSHLDIIANLPVLGLMLMTSRWQLFGVFVFGASQCASVGAREITTAAPARGARPGAPEP